MGGGKGSPEFWMPGQAGADHVRGGRDPARAGQAGVLTWRRRSSRCGTCFRLLALGRGGIGGGREGVAPEDGRRAGDELVSLRKEAFNLRFRALRERRAREHGAGARSAAHDRPAQDHSQAEKASRACGRVAGEDMPRRELQGVVVSDKGRPSSSGSSGGSCILSTRRPSAGRSGTTLTTRRTATRSVWRAFCDSAGCCRG